MLTGVNAFIQKFKSDKIAAIVTFLFIGTVAISMQPEILDGFPESWRAPINSVCTWIKITTIAYGIYFSAQTITSKELEAKLTKIQSNPDQTVLSPKEIVEAAPQLKEIVNVAPAIKEVAESHEVIKQVASAIPEIQKAIAITPVVADLVKKGQIRAPRV